MRSLKQFFSYLNDISFPYVVLRNFENLPHDYNLGEHSDLDLLVYDFDHFFEVFPQAQRLHALPRVRTRIPIGDSVLYVDVRYVGDDYYPVDFEKSILRCREWNERGFWTPDYDHHTIALAYHAVHHKNGIAPEYKKHLGGSSVEELLEALKKSSIGWVAPKDHSVGRFHGYWKGATAVVEKRAGWYVKKQVGYMDFPLIQNEADILNRLSGLNNFPACRVDGDTLEIEDCGVAIEAGNIPPDWRDQLKTILLELGRHGIEHRDIKLDNLVVRDGIIRLIDFGWAVPTPARGGVFEALEASPPSCLGMPNRPSSGFDDAYSMRRVEKQIDFILEESGVCA